jgi:hypothetical protein
MAALVVSGFVIIGFIVLRRLGVLLDYFMRQRK